MKAAGDNNFCYCAVPVPFIPFRIDSLPSLVTSANPLTTLSPITPHSSNKTTQLSYQQTPPSGRSCPTTRIRPSPATSPQRPKGPKIPPSLTLPCLPFPMRYRPTTRIIFTGRESHHGPGRPQTSKKNNLPSLPHLNCPILRYLGHQVRTQFFILSTIPSYE